MSQKLNLEEHISSKEKKQGYVTQMFEVIAPRYDLFTVFFSFGMDRGWKRQLIEMLNPKGHERALDLACGTGDITFALGEKLPAGEAVGLDITTGMIEIANQKLSQRNVGNVSFQLGDIMKMPFPDNSFDYVTCGYALRNVPDVEQAMVEIKRVMKPGGRIISLDFAKPDNAIYRSLYINYLIVAGSLVGIAMHGDADIYRYIPESLKRYPGQHGVRDTMTRVGFTEAGFKVFGGGIMALNFGSKPN
ncbi:MAG: ubiquinone/menaquinone biosynthesis methyltransferase [Blastocatellia bacterium]